MSDFDLIAIREWADYRVPRAKADGGNVDVIVPAAIWDQMLSDLAECADEIERLGGGS